MVAREFSVFNMIEPRSSFPYLIRLIQEVNAEYCICELNCDLYSHDGGSHPLGSLQDDHRAQEIRDLIIKWIFANGTSSSARISYLQELRKHGVDLKYDTGELLIFFDSGYMLPLNFTSEGVA